MKRLLLFILLSCLFLSACSRKKQEPLPVAPPKPTPKPPKKALFLPCEETILAKDIDVVTRIAFEYPYLAWINKRTLFFCDINSCGQPKSFQPENTALFNGQVVDNLAIDSGKIIFEHRTQNNKKSIFILDIKTNELSYNSDYQQDINLIKQDNLILENPNALLGLGSNEKTILPSGKIIDYNSGFLVSLSSGAAHQGKQFLTVYDIETRQRDTFLRNIEITSAGLSNHTLFWIEEPNYTGTLIPGQNLSYHIYQKEFSIDEIETFYNGKLYMYNLIPDERILLFKQGDPKNHLLAHSIYAIDRLDSNNSILVTSSAANAYNFQEGKFSYDNGYVVWINKDNQLYSWLSKHSIRFCKILQ